MKIFKNVAFLVLMACLVSLSSCLKTKEPIATIKAKENEATIQAYLKANNITAQKTDEGLYYVITKANPTGRKPATGDLITLNNTVSRLDGFKLDTTNSTIKTFSPYNVAANFATVFAKYMNEGEKATFIIPSSFLAGGDTDQPNLPAYSPVKFDFSLLNLKNEEEQIENYVADNKLVVTKTTSGLRMAITNPIPAGKPLVAGQNITVKYAGKLLYYSSIKDAAGKPTTTFDAGTLSLTLGAGNFIKGFSEGVALLKVGEKGIVIMPSSLGYGDTGNGNILPKAPLAFELEIISAQ
jgi:FKBP-type peptidyl-prolyl cis-trans isomerase